MATVIAFGVFAAVALLLRAWQRHNARNRFVQAHGFAPFPQHHQGFAEHVRRVDRALTASAFSTQTWLDVEQALHREVHGPRAMDPLLAGELQHATHVVQRERDAFWNRFRTAEEHGYPLRYLVYNRQFGIEFIILGRRADVQGQLSSSETLHPTMNVYFQDTIHQEIAATNDVAMIIR